VRCNLADPPVVPAGGTTQSLDALVKLVLNELFSGCIDDVFEVVFVEPHLAIAANCSRANPPEVTGFKDLRQDIESDNPPA